MSSTIRAENSDDVINAVETPTIIGISSASGPSEIQDALDDWCAGGGIPEFEDDPAES